MNTGSEAAQLVENIPFDVHLHRIHDPSVTILRTPNVLAISVSSNQKWGGGSNRLDDTYE